MKHLPAIFLLTSLVSPVWSQITEDFESPSYTDGDAIETTTGWSVSENGAGNIFRGRSAEGAQSIRIGSGSIKKSGVVANLSLAPRLRNDDFLFFFSGQISIATAGDYTFTLTSDDGSRLWIDDVQIADVASGAGSAVSSPVTLSAGSHSIRVAYFEGTGSESLSLEYEGPGITKQSVPDGVLSTGEDGVAGLVYAYLETTDSLSLMPEWNQMHETMYGGSAPLELMAQGVIYNFVLDPKLRDHFFSFRYCGKITLPTDGTYTFYTNSNDGSRLWINGAEIVDNDGDHANVQKSGTIDLLAGVHDIEVRFYDDDGADILKVRYKGPGIAKDFIPDSVLTTYDGAPGVHYEYHETPSDMKSVTKYDALKSVTRTVQGGEWGSATVSFVDFMLRPVADDAVLPVSTVELDGARLAFIKKDLGGGLYQGAVYAIDGTSGDSVDLNRAFEINTDEADQAREWMRVTLRQDYASASQLYDLYINGEMVAANLGFDSVSEITGPGAFKFTGDHAQDVYLDGLLLSETNPLFEDADKDGISDWVELAIGLNAASNDREGDLDSDGASNIAEILAGTPPQYDGSYAQHSTANNSWLYVDGVKGSDTANGLAPYAAAGGDGPKASVNGAVSASVDGGAITVMPGATYEEGALQLGTKNLILKPVGDVRIK